MPQAAANGGEAAHVRNAAPVLAVKPPHKKNRATRDAQQTRLRHVKPARSQDIKRDLLPGANVVDLRLVLAGKLGNVQLSLRVANRRLGARAALPWLAPHPLRNIVLGQNAAEGRGERVGCAHSVV